MNGAMGKLRFNTVSAFKVGCWTKICNRADKIVSFCDS